jgi:hypothetical protein
LVEANEDCFTTNHIKKERPMTTEEIQSVNQVIGILAEETRTMAKGKPELLLGTPEDFVEGLISRTIDDRYQGNDIVRRWGEVFRDSYKAGTYRDKVAAAAAEPGVGLKDGGPHLLFAEAWAALASCELTRKIGALSPDQLGEVAVLCSQNLLKWSQAGYRMDWHPLEADKQSIDRSSPVGRWTSDWMKTRIPSTSDAPKAGKKRFWQFWK